MQIIDQIVDEMGKMGETAIRAAPKLGIAILLIVAMTFVSRLAGRLVSRGFGKFSHHPYVSQVLGRLARTAVVIVGLLIATMIVFPSFTPASLVQLLGIGSVAVGFAFKDIFQNFLAGILLLITRPFRIGDQIVYDRYEGTVDDIQTRATLITTYDGMRVVIPNASLFTNAVTVRTVFPRRRLQYTIPFGPDVDVEGMRARIQAIVAATPGVLADPPPEVLLVQADDAPVRLRARWWIDTPVKRGAQAAKDEVITAIVKQLGNPLKASFGMPPV